jgi:hypothetical protein
MPDGKCHAQEHVRLRRRIGFWQKIVHEYYTAADEE